MVSIIDVDFNNPDHCQAVIDLMAHYMSDKMGDHPLHDDATNAKMIEGLKNHPNKLCLLAEYEGNYVGLTNCFISFGTFAAKSFINIHDVVVLNTYRGKGVGRSLLNEVTKRAKKMDCGKITLEVREDNDNAQHLYKSVGYKEGEPPMHFWTKYL